MLTEAEALAAQKPLRAAGGLKPGSLRPATRNDEKRARKAAQRGSPAVETNQVDVQEGPLQMLAKRYQSLCGGFTPYLTTGFVLDLQEHVFRNVRKMYIVGTGGVF